MQIDVRRPDEIEATGKVDPRAENIPVEEIEGGSFAFRLNDTNFEKRFGFPKPEDDQTIVFTCRSGQRSARACMHAIEEGYKWYECGR